MNKVKARIQDLEKEGWTRQFIANEPRLSESVEMYRELGYDVHLEPLPREPECESCQDTEEQTEKGGCRICFEGVEDQYKIIFTRPGRPSSRSGQQPANC